MLFKRKSEDSIIKRVYESDRLIRSIEFVVGVFVVAMAFNIFLLPCSIVYGIGGVGVIFNRVYKINPSLILLIGSIVLLMFSYILLGKEKTSHSALGSILYPTMVFLTAPLAKYFNLANADILVLTLFGSLLQGFGAGLIFKSGFTTGGTDILNQIVAKYMKMSIGNAMFITDGLIILFAGFIFGLQKMMYSLIALYIISIMTDKVILGISQSKAFYIITSHETAVKKFLGQYLNHGVTVLDARGGFTGDNKKVLMCIIPTREYFIVKEAIYNIDKNAFFVVTDAYEVSGGK